MRAYIVKHNAAKRGALVDRLATYSICPQSFTSKARAAADAAKGNAIFVVEVRRLAGLTKYLLGYKFIARKCEQQPGGGKWHGQFTFKNEAASPPHNEGVYLLQPIELTDAGLCAWLKEQRFGMAELPTSLLPALESVLMAPSSGARQCI